MIAQVELSGCWVDLIQHDKISLPQFQAIFPHSNRPELVIIRNWMGNRSLHLVGRQWFTR